MASLGSTPGLVIAAGVGAAASTALEPAFEVPRQDAWARNANRILDPGRLSALVARGGVLLGSPDGSTAGSAYEEAKRQGYSSDKLDRMIYLAQHVPEWGQARDLYNRRLISEAQRDEALTRNAYPADWHDPLRKLMQGILSPGELAAAIHRGLVPNPDILLGQQPEPPFTVEAYPVQPIDPVAEAQGSGYDKERLAVLVGLQGLPMGTHEAAEAYFRGVITHGDYIRAFNESNSRNEWAEAVLEYTRQIPTARDYIENALRGYRTFAQAAEGAARHGMTEADARLIFQNSGRPLNLHQITQALAWGAKYNPLPGDDPDPYMNAVLIGPVTPAYYEMQDSLKYNLPSAFYFRTLQQSGVLDETEAGTWYRRLGWPPDLADLVAKAYAKPAATAAAENPYVAKADTQLWTAIHKAYVKIGAPRTEVEPLLTVLIPEDGPRGVVFERWDAERQANTLEPPAVA